MQQQDDKCDDVVYFLLMTNLGIETHLCYVFAVSCFINVLLPSDTHTIMTPNTLSTAIISNCPTLRLTSHSLPFPLMSGH